VHPLRWRAGANQRSVVRGGTRSSNPHSSSEESCELRIIGLFFPDRAGGRAVRAGDQRLLFRGFYEVVRNGAAGSQDDRPATDRLPSESTPDRVDSAVGHPARMRFWTQDDALISSPRGSPCCNTGCLYRFDTEIARPSANALSWHTSAVDARAKKSRAPAIRGRRAVQTGNPRENTQLRTKHESWLGERPAPAIRD
jgi:hypothetical protein